MRSILEREEYESVSRIVNQAMRAERMFVPERKKVLEHAAGSLLLAGVVAETTRGRYEPDITLVRATEHGRPWRMGKRILGQAWVVAELFALRWKGVTGADGAAQAGLAVTLDGRLSHFTELSTHRSLGTIGLSDKPITIDSLQESEYYIGEPAELIDYLQQVSGLLSAFTKNHSPQPESSH